MCAALLKIIVYFLDSKKSILKDTCLLDEVTETVNELQNEPETETKQEEEIDKEESEEESVDKKDTWMDYEDFCQCFRSVVYL